jgi:predicted DNA binding protein
LRAEGNSLSLTEITFEVADDRYPLCRATANPSDATAVLRVLDAGRASGRFRTLISFHGSPEEADALPRDLRASRTGGELDILSHGPGFVTLRTDAPTNDPGSASVRLVAVLRLLDAFGPDTIVEPFLVRRGRIRARVLVPKQVDTQRALVSLQEIQRGSGFRDFRIIRVTGLEAVRYLDLLRRVLTPDQEELLRLAASMGYYETPKGATLEDIAAKVGLSISPVHKRLKTIEETLVSAHVEPTRGASGPHRPRRRRRGAALAIPDAKPLEVALRAHWGTGSGLASFTARHPGARVLLQILAIEPAAGTTTFLLVALAPEKDHAEILDEFGRRSDVLSLDVVDRDPQHCSVKVKLRLGASGATFPWWGEAWGQDAMLRPFIFEHGECAIRFLVLRPLPAADVRERLERAAKLAQWNDWEIVSVRAIGESPSVPTPEPPTPRQEEVLKIAHALGYYRTPRACTLEQVAATLGVSANAIHKNLSSAESKVIAGYLSAGI